ncbi:hypothetical protein D3C74_484220 [compost metagenome]
MQLLDALSEAGAERSAFTERRQGLKDIITAVFGIFSRIQKRFDTFHSIILVGFDGLGMR